MFLETAIFCVALNVYHEARGEPVVGQYAVALVTMNRAERNPKRVCPEVLRPYQFSWTMDHMKRVGNGYQLKATGIPKESDAWDRAVKVAEKVVKGRIIDFTEGATHYHANYVQPAWSKALTRLAVIGNHIFYR